jgi:hypothetical protein
MAQPVLLDNTVLSNFALVERTELVMDLWPAACTTPAVQAEYVAGTEARVLPADVWEGLTVLTLTPRGKGIRRASAPTAGCGRALLYRGRPSPEWAVCQ